MAKENEVKIEMKDGKEKLLKDLTPADLPNVKLTEKDGEKNLTMRAIILKEDEAFKYQRRLFKWTTMPSLVMYELKIPKTVAAFKTLAKDSDILEYAIGNYVIETDKLHCGIEAKGSDPIKALDKIVASLVAKGVPQAEAEKSVAETKKALLKQGFGK
ncbi:hypothetical protein FJZ41_03790 [Candidatus Shapirobacteria bacterium]|nr:hypothetical protein [Candidatus Shapirobacteria bacterium]